MPLSSLSTPRNDGGPVLARKRVKTDDSLDITPMIDVTFLLLIFFLVASVPDVQAALELPRAETGLGVSRKESFTISVAAAVGGAPEVYLADGRYGAPLSGSQTEKASHIRSAVEGAARRGVDDVIIKAESLVKFRDVDWIVRAAGIDGLRVNLAVTEMR